MLPSDVFGAIAENLGGHRPTLCALARSSKFLHNEAERVLYRSFDDSLFFDTSQHRAFLTTLTRNPNLASHVRVYRNNNSLHYQDASLWNLIYQALISMTGLKVLCLESLPGTIFPPTCCPNLKTLSGNRATLDALLPGRRIENVGWIPEFLMSASHDLGRIEIELAQLKKLSYGAMSRYFSRPPFELVVGHLDRLEMLEIVGFSQEEIALLKHITSLRALTFSLNWGSHTDLPIERDSAKRQRLVEDLFSSCPNLMCVDIAYEWTIITEIWYERWTRETQDLPVSILMGVSHGRLEW